MKAAVGKMVIMGLVIAGVSLVAAGGDAAEHGGQEPAGHEHGGQEHGGTTTAEPVALITSAAPVAPSAEAIRQAIRDYDAQIEAAHGGALKIADTVAGQTRALKLERVHERVGKTGSNYYSCADMIDTATGDKVDVDFDVSATKGTLAVVDVRIHKVNGTPRYTYDDKDNRVPLPNR